MKLSAIIITKNSEKNIKRALSSLINFADEVVVVDTGSTDNTAKIASSMKARVVRYGNGGDYSSWRNKGLEESKGEWVFYLDDDEEVTPELLREIISIVNFGTSGAYAVPRKNIILGKEMLHGGWWPDYVKRLYKKENLIKWEGKLHEEPIYKGEMELLKNPIIHYKHLSLSEMVEKTNEWSVIEAELLFKSDHPQMVWWRFLRVMITELWFRMIAKGGILDGTEGIIYALYQMFSKFVTYTKLWEMQQMTKVSHNK